MGVSLLNQRCSCVLSEVNSSPVVFLIGGTSWTKPKMFPSDSGSHACPGNCQNCERIHSNWETGNTKLAFVFFFLITFLDTS